MMTVVRRILVLVFATAFLAMAGLGCNTARGFGHDVQSLRQSLQGAGGQMGGGSTAERGGKAITDRRIEESRTAERVREALAASDDYRYAGVEVTVCDGVVQLSGYVSTSAQKKRAAEVAGKVLGAKRVENALVITGPAS